MAEVPAGKPNVLYYFPELHGRKLMCVCNYVDGFHPSLSMQVLTTTCVVLILWSSAS